MNFGIPSDKLIIGAAMYARIWEHVDNINNGLYQSGNFKQGLPYNKFDSYFSKSKGFKYYFDEKTMSPYRYSIKEKLFATFDDPRSIAAKCNYIKEKKLGGIMFWQIGEEKQNRGLVDEMFRKLRR